MSNVADLMSRRIRRGEPALHFTTATKALAFATAQVAELQSKADSLLVLSAEELDLSLAQVQAVLHELIRLHTDVPERRTPDGC